MKQKSLPDLLLKNDIKEANQSPVFHKSKLKEMSQSVPNLYFTMENVPDNVPENVTERKPTEVDFSLVQSNVFYLLFLISYVLS